MNWMLWNKCSVFEASLFRHYGSPSLFLYPVLALTLNLTHLNWQLFRSQNILSFLRDFTIRVSFLSLIRIASHNFTVFYSVFVSAINEMMWRSCFKGINLRSCSHSYYYWFHQLEDNVVEVESFCNCSRQKSWLCILFPKISNVCFLRSKNGVALDSTIKWHEYW